MKEDLSPKNSFDLEEFKGLFKLEENKIKKLFDKNESFTEYVNPESTIIKD